MKKLDQEYIALIRKKLLERNNAFPTIRKNLIQMRSLLNYARKEMNLKVIDSKSIELPPIKKKRIDFFTLEQLEIVLKNIDKNQSGLRMLAIIAIVLDSAMRISEVLGLDRSSIDLENKRVFIKGKGRKEAWVFFHGWSLVALNEYLLTRNDDCPALFVNHDRGVPKRCTVDGIEKYLMRLSKKVGFRIYLHKFRKTAANCFFRNSRNIYGASTFLRHTDIKTTITFYIGDDVEMLQKEHMENIWYQGKIEKYFSTTSN